MANWLSDGQNDQTSDWSNGSKHEHLSASRREIGGASSFCENLEIQNKIWANFRGELFWWRRECFLCEVCRRVGVVYTASAVVESTAIRSALCAAIKSTAIRASDSEAFRFWISEALQSNTVHRLARRPKRSSSHTPILFVNMKIKSVESILILFTKEGCSLFH